MTETVIDEFSVRTELEIVDVEVSDKGIYF